MICSVGVESPRAELQLAFLVDLTTGSGRIKKKGGPATKMD